MSSKNSSLLRVPIEMPNRSGHNISHSNGFTGKTGTLIPVLCEELLPNDTVSLGANLQVQLPPMVTDFYGRVDFVLEAFFVPNRLCWGGWQDFITHPTANPQYPAGTPVQSKPTAVPSFVVSTDSSVTDPKEITADSLLHYLDYGSHLVNDKQSVLPAIAYHRIYDDWYRDSRIQAPVFYRIGIPNMTSPQSIFESNARQLPFISQIDYSGQSSGTVTPAIFTDTTTLGDNHPVGSLRQRNWVKDYFTSASFLPQAGTGAEVKFDVASATETGAFSISTLRAANSLQKWMERNNLAGYRYSDQIYAQFGVYPADAIMDRCLYLGRNIQTVYNRSVFSTVEHVSNNPETSVSSVTPIGTKAANSQVLGEGSIVDKFTASEHGFLMVLASLVPRPVYGSGAERRNFRLSVGDFAFPLLAGMGDQPIYSYELDGYSPTADTFGYTDLYAEYKFRNDKLHGLLRDGESLSHFALQRSFSYLEQPQLGLQFLEIPTSYLDQVQAVSTSESGYTYWAEIFFPFKKISTIPAYSQPTLADLKNAHTEYISRGGKRL